MKGKTYEDIYGVEAAIKLKDVRSKCAKQRIVTDEMRKTLSNIKKTQIWKENISKSKMGYKISDDTRTKIKNFMSDSDRNPNIDRTIFRFYHIDGRVVDSTKYNMKKLYGCSIIHKIIDKSRKTNNGWSYKGEFFIQE